jgi:hypothetical protein
MPIKINIKRIREKRTKTRGQFLLKEKICQRSKQDNINMIGVEIRLRISRIALTQYSDSEDLYEKTEQTQSS